MSTPTLLEKPQRPPGSPIFPHASGSWVAKVSGKLRYFGGWGDYKAARAKYDEMVAALKYGRDPRPIMGAPVSLERLVDRYLTYKLEQTTTGDLGLRSFRDIKQVIDAFADFIGDERKVGSLEPADFQAFRSKCAKTQGPHALDRTITLVRQMFRWAEKQQLIPHQPAYGLSFQKTRAATKRKAERDAAAEHGRKLFAPGEIRSLLEHAGPQLKAMVLLGINCGFANTDCATLPRAALDLEKGWLEWAREKTGIARRAPLWPETVTALEAAIDARPAPAAEEHGPLVFLTAFGVPWVREQAREVGGVRQTPTAIDALTQAFGKLQSKLGFRKFRRNFQSLRRTFRTFAEELPHRAAARLIMGHEFEGIDRHYVKSVLDAQLLEVSNHVRSRVFAAGPGKGSRRPRAASKPARPSRASKR